MKHIIFDLDGTLADTLPLCIRALQEALQDVTGRSYTDAEIIATFGASEEGTMARLADGQEEKGLACFLQRYRTLHHQYSTLFEGMGELLDYIKRQKAFVGLVTAKGQGSTDITLREYGLEDYFDVVMTGAPTGPIKDKCLEAIIQNHGLRREDVLYIGDSPIDIVSSRKCRVQVAAVAWASTADAALLRSMEPDFFFTSVDAFAAWIKEVIEEDRSIKPTLTADFGQRQKAEAVG